jgi:hypothetical protein
MKKKAVTGISLVLLLLSLISFQLLIPSANAVEYDLGYGAASVLYGSRWQQTETNNNLMNYAFWEISDLFADLYTYDKHTYGHLFEMRDDWDWDELSSQIMHVENNHEWGAVFYYGHRSANGTHRAFHEAGARTGPAPDLIWDEDIYGISGYTGSIHNFVFLWVCSNADDPGSGSPEPHGMAYCWFKRVLSSNGYGDPDAYSDCFIGFEDASPGFSEPLNAYTCKDWLVSFYDFALSGNTINSALNLASVAVGYGGGWTDEDNRLSQEGMEYFWPEWQGPGDKPDTWPDSRNYSGQMKIFGNGNIYLPTQLDWPSNPFVSGPTSGDANIVYQFSAVSTDLYGHNIRYTFDWDDESQDTVTGWYSSGVTAYANHSWSSGGQYNVRVKAECSNGGESDWTSHIIDIGEVHQLTVLAINNYGQPGYVPLYIDGEYVGTTGYTYSVGEGNHTIGVPSPIYGGGLTHVFACYYYDGGYNYDNPMTLSVTEDKTVTACYYTYY